MSQNNEKYAYGGPFPKMGKEMYEREYGQHCDPDDDPYDPFKWSRLLADAKRAPEEKDRLDKIEQSLERIEVGLKQLTGPQLINGVWR